MTLIQLILFLACSSAVLCRTSDNDFESALIGPKYCGDGQVAWCQNFTTAVECNAVRHCVQSVWLAEKSSPSKVGSCQSCESELDNVRPSGDVEKTKEVLTDLFEKACSHPEGCEQSVKHVDSYLNELQDLLKSDLTSARVCHILGSSCAAAANKDDVVVRFENIILHLPADFIDIDESKKLLGSAHCTWGPSYWCKNLTSSKECGSTSHCIHNEWPKQHFSDDNDSVCKVCKDMVQQARDQLQSNETQEELREVFEGSCKLIPVKEVRNECIKLADEFVPELTEMLVSEMNPIAICTIAGLCNSARIDNLLLLQGKSTSADNQQVPDSCTKCNAAVTAVERYLQRAPQSHILDKLIRLCGQLSTFSSACTSLVVSHFSSIYSWLSTEVHPFPVCHMSGMCIEHYHRHSRLDDVDMESKVDTLLATANDDLPCDLCKQLVKHLKDVLTANTTEEEFHAMLVGICQHTKSFKKECLDIVNDDFAKFYKFLTEELDPTEVCQETNLCPKQNIVTDENMNLISHPASPPGADDYKQLALWSPNPIPIKSIECRICKLVIQTVQKEMDNPEYEHNIEKILEKVCSLVPRKDEDSCDQFIQEYANVLIKMLSDQTDPGIVCAMLNLCIKSQKTVDVRNRELCPICQYVMHFVQEELEKPEEQQKVEDVVRRVCNYVPKSQQTECQEFVTDYSTLIITVLSQELDPSLVCPALKLCPSLWSPVDRCLQCQHLMADLVTRLAKNFSKSSVEYALSTLVPAKRSNSTLTALELKVNHAEDIVDMMEAEFDSQESCMFLHFCDATMISATVQDMVTGAESDEQGANDISVLPPSQFAFTKPSCEMCELILQMYENMLTSNATEKEIEGELQKWCNKIKNVEFRSNCSLLVQKYVPEAIKLLKKDVSPKEVCGLVKLCPSQVNVPEITTEGNQRCELCEAVVGSLEGIAADPQVSSRTMSRLIDVCNVFSQQKERAECMKIVSIVGPELVSFVFEIPSWYFCSKIHMCPYGAHLTYKKVCDDSSQWCADVPKAVLCGKLEYCRQTVWKSDKPSPKPLPRLG